MTIFQCYHSISQSLYLLMNLVIHLKCSVMNLTVKSSINTRSWNLSYVSFCFISEGKNIFLIFCGRVLTKWTLSRQVMVVVVTIIIGEPRAVPAPSFSWLTRTATHSAVEIFRLLIKIFFNSVPLFYSRPEIGQTEDSIDVLWLNPDVPLINFLFRLILNSYLALWSGSFL